MIHIMHYGSDKGGHLIMGLQDILKNKQTNISFIHPSQLGLQRYNGVPVRRDIFCHVTNIIYWTNHDIYDTFTYA